MVFDFTRFIQDRAPPHTEIGIDGKRTDIDEAREDVFRHDGVKKIARRYDGILEAGRKGFASAGHQMEHNLNIFYCSSAVVTRQ